MIRVLAIAATLLISYPSVADAKRHFKPPRPPSTPIVLLNETFDGPAGTAPDPARWVRYTYCDKWTSLSCNTAQNAVLDGDGNLALTARYAPGHVDSYGNKADWTGARVESGKRWENTALFSFFHGTASAWIRMPAAQGTWASWWLLNLKDSLGRYGEIDVAEALGHETPGGVWHATLHSWTNSTHMAGSGQPCDADVDLTAAFHKYTVRWSTGRVDILLDEHLCLSSLTSAQLQPWYFDFRPAILLLSLDVGGWAGTPTDPSRYPVSMLVDRVQVTIEAIK